MNNEDYIVLRSHEDTGEPFLSFGLTQLFVTQIDGLDPNPAEGEVPLWGDTFYVYVEFKSPNPGNEDRWRPLVAYVHTKSAATDFGTDEWEPRPYIAYGEGIIEFPAVTGIHYRVKLGGSGKDRKNVEVTRFFAPRTIRRRT